MPQYDGYVRISTENDTSSARRSTEQLGNTIRDAMDTQPVDRMTQALEGMQQSTNNPNTSGLDGMRNGIDSIGTSALNTGDLIRANLLSDTIMQGVMTLGEKLKDLATDSVIGAMNNESDFAKAKTLLKGSDLEKYYDELIEISNRKRVEITQLSDSIYSALSASVPQDEVLEFVEDTVNLSKGGFTDMATAIDIVTTALNAYQLEMSEATHIQDVLITTQNLGKTTVDELAGNMGKLIPTAKSVNVEFDQLGAMYATITANGVATAETTTYLNAMINELGASGSSAEQAMMEAVKGIDMAGKKFSEISSMGYDVTDVLVLMNDYAQSTGKSLADMFSSSEGAKAANILLSNMAGFKDNIVAMEQSAGAASEAAAIMMDTTAEKVNGTKNQIDNLVTTIGQALLPVIGEAADEVSDALQSGDVTETAENIGKFVSGTLSVLLKNIKLISSAVAGVTAGVVAFKTASVLTKVIASWQTAALQVNRYVASQGRAALQTAATNGTLTMQEVIFAALSGKLDAATIKTYALNTAMSLNPAGAIAAVIGVLATALTGYSLATSNATSETSEWTEKANKLADSIQNITDSIEDSISKNEAEMTMLKNKADRYDELRTAVSLTADEEAELKGLALDLQNVLGDNVSVINSLTGEYNNLTTAVDNYIKKQSAEVKLSAYENASKNAYIVIDEAQQIVDDLETQYGRDFLEAYNQYLNGLEDVKEEMDDVYGAYNGFRNLFGSGSGGSSDDTSDELVNATRTWERAIDDIKTAQSTIDTYEELLKEMLVDEYGSDFSFTPDSSTSSGYSNNNDEQLQKFKEQQKWLKYEYDMGLIDAEQYYSILKKYRNEYLNFNTDEYRSVSVEIKKFYDNLSEEQKKAYQKQLEEQEKAAAEAEAARKKAIEESEAARKKAYNDEKSQLEFKLKTNKISEKKYYEEIAKLRDKYLDKNSDEWRSAYLETYEYNQRILQENKDALNQLLSDTADSTLSALQNITAARDSLTSKLIDFNKTFEKITETVPETVAVKGNFTITTAEHEVETYKMGADSIEDNIRVLEQYGEMLDALKSRGADENTLNDILAMDIEDAMEYGTKMLKMSDRDWNSYFDSMQRLRQTAADISAQYYRSEAESLKENFVDKLKSELEGLGSDMFSVGADVAAEFVNGWNEALGTKDLTVGDILRSVASRTIDTAPRAAQQMSAAAAASIGSSGQNSTTKLLNIPIYIGTTKLADIMVDALNGKILKDGKNVLLT